MLRYIFVWGRRTRRERNKDRVRERERELIYCGAKYLYPHWNNVKSKAKLPPLHASFPFQTHSCSVGHMTHKKNLFLSHFVYICYCSPLFGVSFLFLIFSLSLQLSFVSFVFHHFINFSSLIFLILLRRWSLGFSSFHCTLCCEIVYACAHKYICTVYCLCVHVCFSVCATGLWPS